ncbi:hypothetical protein [Marinobacter sp. SS5-14b]|uniref:hypothetical protein n=1 Tax=Marinobacter sp. SS5-14b TaxID=3050456 RepID=UPI0026DECD7B|nr:hypothetical protein [Marinobacter sp. SS5-14b]
MSYQLYVTGGYGFTERILPSLLHPSEAISIAQDYFSRGYQGAHIEPSPDSGFRVLEKASSSERQGILDALQSGQMVLARQGGASFGLFTEHNASPDHLRSDLPKPLVSRLREQWPTGTGGGLTMRSDSLHAPAKQDYQRASEPVAAPIPGKGPYKLTIQYRWPDGTGVADLPFQVGTDLDSLSGVLDHQGAATVDGLNGRYATVRLSSNASDDTVRHERKAIIAGLDRLLGEERRETESRAQGYQVLPWYQKAVVSVGAFAESAFDAAGATVDYVFGMYSLNSPAALALDVLKSTWSCQSRQCRQWMG